MKIVHNTGWYFPDSTGGTEVYVEGLIRELQKQYPSGINLVAAPQSGTNEYTYEYNGKTVYRYPDFPDYSLPQIRAIQPHGGFDCFARWLTQQQAQIYHQHSWTTGCGIHHLRYAKSLGLKTVVTVHVPGNVCLRGTMLLHGNEPCNGEIQQTRCSICWANARGLTPAVAALLARVPLAIGDWTAALPFQSRLVSALATPALVKAHQQRLLEMTTLADRIVAVCQWLYDALLLNGVPEEKLILSRQGIDSESFSTVCPIRTEDGTLHIGFLGRLDPVKGIHILIQAIRRLPEHVPVKLTIHGIAQGAVGKAYQQELLQLAADEARIHFAEPLSRIDILPTLANFDLLAVPSQLLETGPIVVLEAQAVGTPVLGSNIGGVAELVVHGSNGWLVPASKVEAWNQAILYLASNVDLVKQLRCHIQPIRTMGDVAIEMAQCYQEIINK